MTKRKPIESMELKNIHFAYEGGPNIFESVSLVLPKTRALWVRAIGGRGKTSLLKLLAGLLSPQSGDYYINGQNVLEMSFEQFLPYRLSLGYAFDSGGLLSNRSLAENLILPLLYHKLLHPDEALDRVQEVFAFFGLLQAAESRPSSVSGSQRKLACVIRSFIHWPQVVFLDDPITGLKDDNLDDLLHFVTEGFSMRGLRQVIFTGENPDLAQRLGADELLISPDWFTLRSAA